MKAIADSEQIPVQNPKPRERNILSPYSRMAQRLQNQLPGDLAAEALFYYDYADECIEEVSEGKTCRP